MRLFRTIEAIAARGADGLTPESRKELVRVLLESCTPDGGHPDLTRKHSDPYYSFFAWLCLRALTHHPPATLVRYFHDCPAKNDVDLFCKTFVTTCGLPPVRQAWKTLSFLIKTPPKTAYSLLLAGLLLDHAFPLITPLFTRMIRDRTRFALEGQEALATSRIAAQLLMSSSEKERRPLRQRLLERHVHTGGFRSAPHAAPDLLATAAARVALGPHAPAGLHDLHFAEACWTDHGLFSPQPGTDKGDVEHTYYALLVLGSCRGQPS